MSAFIVLSFCNHNKIQRVGSIDYDKLYVTKSVFGRDIGGLYEVMITHFFMSVNTSR